MTERYFQSEQMLERALRTIPLGSQTFSKSKTHYPFGVSPYFIQKGHGSRVWDVDGNEYIDYVNSLCAVTLGYNDPDVTAAVKLQLEEGVIFSLPHPIEMEVAEKIVELVPCAEKVRFAKNGSDATAGAIRLSRAWTRRDHVAVCGYHGWQDWYIGSTELHQGVPDATRKLTHKFIYNDIESLKQIFLSYPGEIAAVILEPMNIVEPQDDFLHEVKQLTHEQGALLIFDETITGFRFANGGAQEWFGVTPDLATFGKGLANGYPLSAVAGRADVMKLMEEIFFSFTFGGETLSLAASLATMNKLQREPVVASLYSTGEKVMHQTRASIKKYGLEQTLSISGHPSWSFLGIRETDIYTQWELKTLFLQEMFARGILIIGSHNMSYSHTDNDLEQLSAAFDQFCYVLKESIENKSLYEHLQCKVLEPLFRVR